MEMNNSPMAMTLMRSELAAELAELTQRLQQSTVQVRGWRSGMGSGVIWHADGLILTNAHVVRGHRINVRLSDGRSVKGQVIRKDWQQDLAALVVPVNQLPAVTVHAEDVRAGELVLAVGNPQGVHNATCLGIVHTTASSQRTRWIQADLRLAPGYSGGPLATMQGAVIGINSMIVEGRAFAISCWAIDRFLSSQQERPYLGVRLQPVQLMVDGEAVPGWVVTAIIDGSPAAAAGCLGDIWIGVDGRRFTRHQDLQDWLSLVVPGDCGQLMVVRGQQFLELTLEVGSQSAEWEAA